MPVPVQVPVQRPVRSKPEGSATAAAGVGAADIVEQAVTSGISRINKARMSPPLV